MRQDISTLRFELLDIFHNNNYKINDIEKKMTACASGAESKKVKLVERRILKDFHIGFVETLRQEIDGSLEDKKDIFTSLAKIVGAKKTHKRYT